MSVQPQIRIQPWKAAQELQNFQGYIPVSSCKRLLPLLNQTEGEVEYQLDFSTDDKERPKIRISVQATLVLQCQRCLEPMQQQVALVQQLIVVKRLDEAMLLETDYDPLLVDSTKLIRLSDVVEEELLLAIPAVAKHEKCNHRWMQEPRNDKLIEKQTESPFMVLKELKQSN